jgi:hypothetical protein
MTTLHDNVTGVTVFADVDLRPDETEIDFSEQSLPPASQLGTVGLWCALHGDSLLQAGMHHLEARFVLTKYASSGFNKGSKR